MRPLGHFHLNHHNLSFTKKIFLWWRVTVIFACGYTDNYLKCGQELCGFSKVLIVIFFRFHYLVSPGQLARFPVSGKISLLLSKTQVQLELVVTIKPCVPLLHPLLWLSFHADHHCGLQALQLGRTIVCFPFLEACMGPSGTIKADLLEGSIQVRFSSEPPRLVTIIHIFSKRDLPLTSDRQ